MAVTRWPGGAHGDVAPVGHGPLSWGALALHQSAPGQLARDAAQWADASAPFG